MTRDVIVVESEQKARTIAALLPGEVEILVVGAAPVKATLLPPADPLKREPPKFSFARVPEQQEFFSRLPGAGSATLYFAFDSDQRGEYWAWLVNEYLLAETSGLHGGRRLHLFGLSRDELRESFRMVEPVDSDQAVAYHLRMLFNTHLTHHLRRLLGTASGPQGLPLTGDTLAILFLLAEREAEIRAFTPPPKWQVRVRLASETGEFDARLEEAYGVTDDGYVRDAGEARDVAGMFRGQPFTVGEVVEEEIRIEAPAPFRLLELLQEAYLAHGLSPLQTMGAVRALYEGTAVGGEQVGLVSSAFSQGQIDGQPLLARVRDEVARRFGAGALAESPREFEMKGVLLPLRPESGPGELAGVLDQAAQQVYGLIHARALASQMRDAEGILRDLGFHAGKACFFRAGGRNVRTPGFLAAYQGQQFRDLAVPSPLAGLRQGQEVRNIQIIPEQTAGFPPEHYTFEGLASDLADFSLPLDGAGVAMLQRMLDGGYVALMPDGTCRCRENSATLIAVMNKAFPSMKGIHFAAYFEQTVVEAVTRRKPLALALQQFDQTMMMQGNVLVKVAMPVAARPRGKTSRSIIKSPGGEAPVAPPAASVAQPAEEAAAVPPVEVPVPEEVAGEVVSAEAEPVSAPPVAGEILPAEGGTAEPEATEAPSETAGRAEAEPEVSAPALELEPEALVAEEEPAPASQELFAAAAREPEPTVPEPAAPAVETPQAGPTRPCPDCGRPLLLKEDRFGKFWFCSGHPECRHSESYGKEAGLSLLCPLCQTGKVVSKQTPTGKPFYVCPEPDCEFMAWSRPHPISCQVCDSPFLVEKKNLAGKISLRCPRAGCNYMQPLPGEGDSAPAPGAPVATGQAPGKKKVLVRRVKGGASSTGGVRKVRVVRRKA
ncbi:MAG: DNA topoisomerase [Thermodesulfobacteriota bacterium]